MWSKSWFKVLMVVILQITLSIPIYLLATFLLPSKLKQGIVYENIVIIVLYSVVLYLCLLIISNKLVKEYWMLQKLVSGLKIRSDLIVLK